MPVVQIRNFKEEDMKNVIALWNNTLATDKKAQQWYIDEYGITDAKMRRILTNPNYDAQGAFVACCGSEIVGYARGVTKKIATYKGENFNKQAGFLEALVVEKSHRRKGVGTELLGKVENYFRSQNKTTFRVSAWSSTISNIAVLFNTEEYRFLLKHEYSASGGEIALKLKLDEFKLTEKAAKKKELLQEEGIQFVLYEDKYYESFSKQMPEEFPGWWNAIYVPHFNGAYPYPFVVAVEKGEVAGFIGFVYADHNKNSSFHLGVFKKHRGRGIGKALVECWVKEVQKVGAQTSYIGTGVENYSAQKVYFEMGYKKLGEARMNFRKQLDDA